MNLRPSALRQWLGAWAAYLKAGDLLVLALALVACGLSVVTLWQGGRPDRAVIKSGGRVFAEVDLTVPRILEVPGPRQYCVRQGWLSRAGAVAICAPNQVSLALSGGNADYDSLNY